ncbi:MAG: ABC transporter ATP-binding protein [Ruminococcus sp.]|jgi:nickel transport system ATP-binding protein|nr:ABC transporter ATP-binding protein [Ruminococcus sp.]
MIELQHINVSFRNELQKKLFGTERKKVLRDISVRVEKGECLGILGESGSGKSTMGKVLCGLLKPDNGEALIEGENIYSSRKGRKLLRDKISVVFQDYTTSSNPRFHIKDIIGEGITVRERKTKKKIERKEEVARLLTLVGLDETYANRFPHELSGGQLQRVCIARAVACDAEIILLDEAVSSLDAHTQVQIMDLLIELKNKLNLTYIFITHDLTSITYFCDRVLFLNNGRVTEVTKTSNIGAVTDEYALKLLHSIIDFMEEENHAAECV